MKCKFCDNDDSAFPGVTIHKDNTNYFVCVECDPNSYRKASENFMRLMVLGRIEFDKNDEEKT